MNDRRLAIRMDLDTTVGARGLSKLLELSKEMEFPFTLFVNMGRSTSLMSALRRRVASSFKASSKATPSPAKLGLFQKLGIFGFFETLILNPNLFPVAQRSLFELRDAGVEIGLHGGMNHGIWQTSAAEMQKDQMTELLLPAIVQFKEQFGTGFGFASPGFQRNPFAYQLLADSGCFYVSDHIQNDFSVGTTMDGLLPDVPVTLSGPDTIDFLEHRLARGRLSEISRSIEMKFETSSSIVYYTHPCFVLGPGLNVFREFVLEAKQRCRLVVVSDLLSNAA
jgi:hypothetical protein